MNPTAYVRNAAKIASSSLVPSAKNTLLNTSVAAVPYRKNSYHSTTVPAIDATTTLLSPVGIDPGSLPVGCDSSRMLMTLLYDCGHPDSRM